MGFELQVASFLIEGCVHIECSLLIDGTQYQSTLPATPESVALTILKALVANRPDFKNLFALY